MMLFKVNSRQMYAFTASLAAIAMTLAPRTLDAAEPEHTSQYQGQEKRDIKSLSADDIHELTTGGGWGLAKAAELNGLPGPKHVLGMKREIDLTADQEHKIREIYAEMNKEAVDLGRQLVELERELDGRFAQKDIDEEILEDLLTRISGAYRSLRYAHLSAHLRTPNILSDEQISKYNDLRGYSSGDPCANIPKGHDPVMWRKHNNCD